MTRIRRLLTTAALIVAVDVVLASTWVTAAVSAARDQGAAADAAVVLWGDDAQWGEESDRRVTRAAALWTGGRVKLIICVGGSRPMRGFDGAVAMAEALRKRGIPTDAIIVGKPSNDVQSNLDSAAAATEVARLRSVLLVGDPLVVARVLWFLVDRLRPLEVRSGAYDLGVARPEVHLPRLWRRAHHEWGAIASLALPEGTRLNLIGLLRR